MPVKPKVVTLTLNPAIDQTVSVPNFRVGQVNRVGDSRLDPGGKGVNVASCLADYGFPVTVTGFLGNENDRIFRQLFAGKAIEDRFVRITGRTRVGIKLIDPAQQITTDVNFPGQRPASTDLEALFAIVEDLATSHEWFVFSGSLPEGVPSTIYRDLARRLRGRQVVVDTSGEAFRHAVSAGPSMVKPNLDELSSYLGQPLEGLASVVLAARDLSSFGITTVVVSMGEQGAVLVEGDQALLARPPGVTVQSTVGAGDAMLAGMVAGKSLGYSLAASARLATAFAVDALSHIGSGLSSVESVLALAEQVNATPIGPADAVVLY